MDADLAPFSGIVGLTDVAPGALVNPGDVVVTEIESIGALTNTLVSRP